MSATEPAISVVIATRDRSRSLRRVTSQITSQMLTSDELIIADDTSVQTDLYHWLPARTRVLYSCGRGPAVARNLGWRAAAGEVIAFTDDDVSVDEGWLAAIRAAFAADTSLLALEGHTLSRVFDPLYEYSVCSEEARNGLTCNVAYRKSALERLGGFDEGFQFAHCEDQDLFLRAQSIGRSRFSQAMRVHHEPRAIRPCAFARRAGWLGSEHRLYVKHPNLKPYPFPPVVSALAVSLRWPIATLFRGSLRRLCRDPRRLARALTITFLWWWHTFRAIPPLLLTRCHVAD